MKPNARPATIATSRKLPISEDRLDHCGERQLKQKVQQLRMGIFERIVFLQEFLKHPRQVASIVPSSHVLDWRPLLSTALSRQDR